MDTQQPIIVNVYATGGDVSLDNVLVGKVQAPILRTEVIQQGLRIGGNYFGGQA